MFEQILQKLGLSPNEAKIYETLLSLDSANVSTIAVKSKIHRRNVYDCINKLIEKGLVSELSLDTEKQFKAVNPNRLLALVKEKEDILLENLPLMQARFQEAEHKEQAYVYKGIQGFKNYLQDILDLGEDVYCIASKNGWADKNLEAFMLRFYQRLHKKGIKVYNLFDYEMKDEIPDFLITKKIPYKILPQGYSTDSAVDIFGNHIVTFTGISVKKLEKDLTLFVTISSKLANSYRNWFRMIWNLLPGEQMNIEKKLLKTKSEIGK